MLNNQKIKNKNLDYEEKIKNPRRHTRFASIAIKGSKDEQKHTDLF